MPSLIVGLALSTDSVATCFGSTVSCTGVEGWTVLTSASLGLRVLVNGIGAKPRNTMLYVPGGTLRGTVRTSVAIVLAGGEGQVAERHARRQFRGIGRDLQGALNSGKQARQLERDLTLSPSDDDDLVHRGDELARRLVADRQHQLRSSRVMVGMFCCGCTAQVIVAGPGLAHHLLAA